MGSDEFIEKRLNEISYWVEQLAYIVKEQAESLSELKDLVGRIEDKI